MVSGITLVSLPSRINDWFETHWIVPAYVGWVLLGLAAFFFAAATNTLAGWLYVMSGVLLGLLMIAAILPPRNLAGIEVERQPIRPVSAGEPLLIELTLTNTTRRAKALLQARDEIPQPLGQMQQTAIAAIAPSRAYRWLYEIPTERRGIYRWQTVTLRSAAPLGLFWCRRPQAVNASATVYPQILPLSQCPLLDALGEKSGQQSYQNNTVQVSTEGITRSLRPYRWGDSTRLIHWRTSARYGELRVRELEKITAGQQVIIALNTADTWNSEAFEQAVVAAASLYLYALRRGFSAALWTSEEKLVRDKVAVLSLLAGVTPNPGGYRNLDLPTSPIIWLTPYPWEKGQLSRGSRQVCWGSSTSGYLNGADAITWINPEEALQIQLQARQ
ncbi:MAG TPA: DUF58 domain-containing protein [Leptolyngbyaceae cyanobacterium]